MDNNIGGKWGSKQRRMLANTVPNKMSNDSNTTISTALLRNRIQCLVLARSELRRLIWGNIKAVSVLNFLSLIYEITFDISEIALVENNPKSTFACPSVVSSFCIRIFFGAFLYKAFHLIGQRKVESAKICDWNFATKLNSFFLSTKIHSIKKKKNLLI